MITEDAVRAFLAGHRIAVVGASDSKDSFGRSICRALVDHGYDAVPIHPNGGELDGRACYPHLADVPEPVDGVIVMVPPDVATDVVDEAAAAGIDQVWLFKGIGGPGSVSDEVLAACQRHHIEPVAGACPLMFLDPVGGVHRIHRGIRRMKGDVERASS
jgi:acetyltransferase